MSAADITVILSFYVIYPFSVKIGVIASPASTKTLMRWSAVRSLPLMTGLDRLLASTRWLAYKKTSQAR